MLSNDINKVIQIVIILMFCMLSPINTNLYSQHNQDDFANKNIPLNKKFDSLSQKTFKELAASYYSSNDTIRSYLYAKKYLDKAKKEKDTIAMARGYGLLGTIQKKRLEITYFDSVISLTKNIKHKSYPTLPYIRKGIVYYINKEYSKALDNYLIAQEYAQKSNNVRFQIAIKHNIALLKKAVGGRKETVRMFKENLEYIRMQDTTIFDYFGPQLYNLYGIADSFNKMKMPDSAKIYIKKGLDKSLHFQELPFYADFLMLSGINNNLFGNYQQALDSLYKAANQIKNLKYSNINEPIIYLQTAKALLKTNRETEAIIYLKKIDSITDVSNYDFEKKEAFDLLIGYYKDRGDLKNQLRVTSKLIEMDTLFNKKNIDVRSDILKKYELAQLISSREDIISQIKKQKDQSTKSFYFVTGIAIILTIILFSYYRKQKKYKQRFEELYHTQTVHKKNEKQQVLSKEKMPLAVPEEIIKNVLNKLTVFENELGFLEAELSLNKIAKRFGTNSKYLSQIVNTYKENSFNHYINELRINQSIIRLKTDSKFRNYTIKAIAREAGFNNTDTFSKAFYKQNGIHPSYFIKELEKQLGTA